MKIGFVTCDATKLAYYFPTLAEPFFIPLEPPFTPDDQIAVNDLRKNGYHISPVVWGGPISKLKNFQLIIVRSPWDYMDNDENKSKFMDWIKRLEQSGILVVNPSHFMQWLLDKHYLRDLDEQGVHTIPTHYLEPHSRLDLKHTLAEKGGFILKPCISAAGIGLMHIQSMDDALHYQEEIDIRLKHTAYMLQDFIPEIKNKGEWSLVFLGGRYSHAVHKKPGENSIFVHAERGGSLSFSESPPKAVIEFAHHTYQKILPAFLQTTSMTLDPQLILYLRLDIIETEKGPLLIECEGVEPELFFRAQPQSEVTFRRAIDTILLNR